MPKEVLGTGLSGLVGSRIVELNPQFKFTDLSLETGHDILKPQTLDAIFTQFSGDTVIHLAAFTDTTAAWQQRGDKAGLCYRLNVEGTENILRLCQKYHKYLIHISTDFVFDGTSDVPYTETSQPNPIEWYGMTKYLAEKMILDSKHPSSIVRIAFPYRANFATKTDLVRKMIEKLAHGQTLNLFSDQIITPTFIDDIAEGLGIFIDQQPKGIYHLVGSSSISPFKLAQTVAAQFGFNLDLVKPSSLSDYANTPNTRPYARNLTISNEKFVRQFGLKPLDVIEGLQELKQQLSRPLAPKN